MPLSKAPGSLQMRRHKGCKATVVGTHKQTVSAEHHRTAAHKKSQLGQCMQGLCSPSQTTPYTEMGAPAPILLFLNHDSHCDIFSMLTEYIPSSFMLSQCLRVPLTRLPFAVTWRLEGDPGLFQSLEGWFRG